MLVGYLALVVSGPSIAGPPKNDKAKKLEKVGKKKTKKFNKKLGDFSLTDELEEALEQAKRYSDQGLWLEAQVECQRLVDYGARRGHICMALVNLHMGQPKLALGLVQRVKAETPKGSRIWTAASNWVRHIEGYYKEHKSRAQLRPHVTIDGAHRGDGRTVLRVRLTNPSGNTLEIENVHSSELDARAIQGIMRWHQTDGKAKPNTTIVGDFIIPSERINLTGFSVTFNGTSGLTSVTRTISPVVVMTFLDKRHFDHELSVQGLFGSYLMTRGTDGATTLDATTTHGVSMRYAKGLKTWGALESELVVGRTGEVQFENVSHDGVDGDLKRSATFGRLSAFGVLRRGLKNVLSFRIGLGIQATTYDSVLTPNNGTPVIGPGDGFAVQIPLHIGLAYERRLGRNWRIGATANAMNSLSAKDQMFTAGLRIGYGWGIPDDE